jgi:hypothetical protein
MTKKSFKIARKPGQGDGAQVAITETKQKARARKNAPSSVALVSANVGQTTRKTIEVPEDYFRRVKIRAVERGILEKELWAEIVSEYFEHHPAT